MLSPLPPAILVRMQKSRNHSVNKASGGNQAGLGEGGKAVTKSPTLPQSKQGL